MPKQVKSIRWTVNMACTEYGVHHDKITKGLKTNGGLPGKDGRFSTQQIADAIFGGSALEREAKAARHRESIDNAEMTRLRREVEEGKWIEKRDVVDGIADIATKLAQFVKHSKLSESEKTQGIQEIAELRSKWE